MGALVLLLQLYVWAEAGSRVHWAMLRGLLRWPDETRRSPPHAPVPFPPAILQLGLLLPVFFCSVWYQHTAAHISVCICSTPKVSDASRAITHITHARVQAG